MCTPDSSPLCPCGCRCRCRCRLLLFVCHRHPPVFGRQFDSIFDFDTFDSKQFLSTVPHHVGCYVGVFARVNNRSIVPKDECNKAETPKQNKTTQNNQRTTFSITTISNVRLRRTNLGEPGNKRCSHDHRRSRHGSSHHSAPNTNVSVSCLFCPRVSLEADSSENISHWFHLCWY